MFVQSMSYTTDDYGNWDCTVHASDGRIYRLQITKREWLAELESVHPVAIERVRNRILGRKLAEAMERNQLSQPPTR